MADVNKVTATREANLVPAGTWGNRQTYITTYTSVDLAENDKVYLAKLPAYVTIDKVKVISSGTAWGASVTLDVGYEKANPADTLTADLDAFLDGADVAANGVDTYDGAPVTLNVPTFICATFLSANPAAGGVLTIVIDYIYNGDQ